MAKPTRIDELLRRDHFFLEEGDDCYAFGEYTAGAGYACGATNNLLSNLKKEMDREGLPEWRYKEEAIAGAAALLQGLPAPWLRQATLVPIPPSAAEGEPAYDDRLVRILDGLARRTGLDLDIRPLLYQAESTRSSSRSEGERLSPLDLRQVYRLKPELALPVPSTCALFDDLLTWGAHFRAAKDLLRERWPGVPVVGIFLARRALTTGR